MGKLLFRIARLKILGTFVGLAFAYFPLLIPVKKIVQNKKVVAFKHPSPSYPDHILIIPRKIARTMFHLSYEDFWEAVETTKQIRHGGNPDFVLMINGGKRQDVMQAHFHLFTGNLAVQNGLSKKVDFGFLQPETHTSLNLRDMLKQFSVSEEAFSLVFQFENEPEPSIYFM